MKWHKRLLFSGPIAILALSGNAFAGTFYIVKEKSGPCKVVEGRPPPTMTIIGGGNKTYTTREEAEKDMALACKTG
jgi:hypothetical protein